MALPIKNFNSKINGKNAYAYTKQLNYKLKTQEERKELLNNIMNKENDDFFVQYFDNFHKVNVNKEDFLSIDKNICKSLEQMANYLLLAPDAKDNDEIWKTNYIFYSDKAMGKKIENDYKRRIRTIMFLVDKSRNYRKEIKQAIFESDYKDQDFNTEVKLYLEDNPENFHIEISNYLKNINDMSKCCQGQLKNKKLNYKQKSILKSFMKEAKTDSIIIKDKIKGTVYYNDCLPESEETNWFLFNFTDMEHMLALLKIPERNIMTDLGIIIYDFNQLLNQTKITDFEKEVIELWRESDTTQENIAEELGVGQPYISDTLRSICKKLILQYKENYEEWLLLNYLKGDWKKCSQCGEIKLISKFGKDINREDGLEPRCKICRKN